jgi:hypothetical protein
LSASRHRLVGLPTCALSPQDVRQLRRTGGTATACGLARPLPFVITLSK